MLGYSFIKVIVVKMFTSVTSILPVLEASSSGSFHTTLVLSPESTSNPLRFKVSSIDGGGMCDMYFTFRQTQDKKWFVIYPW